MKITNEDCLYKSYRFVQRSILKIVFYDLQKNLRFSIFSKKIIIFFLKNIYFFHFHNLQNRSSIKIRKKKVASTWIWTRDPWLTSPPLYLCANWDWCIWLGQIKYIKYNVSILMSFLQFFVVYWDLGNFFEKWIP